MKWRTISPKDFHVYFLAHFLSSGCYLHSSTSRRSEKQTLAKRGAAMFQTPAMCSNGRSEDLAHNVTSSPKRNKSGVPRMFPSRTERMVKNFTIPFTDAIRYKQQPMGSPTLKYINTSLKTSLEGSLVPAHKYFRSRSRYLNEWQPEIKPVITFVDLPKTTTELVFIVIDRLY